MYYLLIEWKWLYCWLGAKNRWPVKEANLINLIYLSQFTMKHQHILDWKLDLSLLNVNLTLFVIPYKNILDIVDSQSCK